MRLAMCAMSAVLLSGCSWLGGFGSSGHGYSHAQKGQYYGQQGQHAPQQAASRHYNGGFAQKPDFNAGYGAANYTTGGYGSHASTAGQQGANYSAAPRARKPKLRGSLSLGIEKSNSGSLLDFNKGGFNYNPDDYNETVATGSVATGNITTRTYSVVEDKVKSPTISFDDVYSTPARLAAGVEYIASPHLTLFANGAYSVSEGQDGHVASVEGRFRRDTSSQDYDPGTGAPDGAATTSTDYYPNELMAIPNEKIANFAYDFNDMRRYEVEIGGRYYMNPIIKDQAHRTLTPFVGASIGASHHNKIDYSVSHQQRDYSSGFESGGTNENFYDAIQATPRVRLYDAQWTPTGNLTAGMEWQVTSGAAVAVETGLRFEKARDYSNGAKGDNNIAVPLTLRGSFNF